MQQPCRVCGVLDTATELMALGAGAAFPVAVSEYNRKRTVIQSQYISAAMAAGDLGVSSKNNTAPRGFLEPHGGPDDKPVHSRYSLLPAACCDSDHRRLTAQLRLASVLCSPHQYPRLSLRLIHLSSGCDAVVFKTASAAFTASALSLGVTPRPSTPSASLAAAQ